VDQDAVNMKSNIQRLVVVLGMHRSGTSAIARGLKVLGVDLGNHFLSPDKDINETGYWEDIDFNQLNIDLLHALDTDWHHLAPIPGDFVERLRERGFMLRAVELLREKVGELPVFGFKDPRTALLLPFWKEVFAHCKFEVSYLLAIRNPISVIRSLEQRDRFDLEKSALLWLTHTVSMMEGTTGIRSRVLVDYDSLLRAPEDELHRVAEALNLSVNASELQIYKTEFLKQSLRHTIYDTNDLALSSFTNSLIHDLYAKLLDASSGAIAIDDSSVSEQVAKSKRELARWEYPLSIVDPLFHFKRFASGEITVRDSKIDELQRRLEQTQSDFLVAQRAMADRDLKINELNDSVAEANSQKHNLQNQLEQREGDLLGARRDTVDRDLKIVALTAADTERGPRIQELQHRLKHNQDLLLGAQRALAAADLKTAELISTVSDRELRIDALGRSLSDSQLQIGNLMRTVGAYEQQISQLARQSDSTVLKIETLERTVAEQVESIRSSRAVRSKLQSEVDEKRDLLVSNENQIVVLRESLRSRDAQIDELKRYAAENDLRIADLEATVGTLRSQVRNVLESAQADAVGTGQMDGKTSALRTLLSFDGLAFVRTAYLSILRRPPDVNGQLYYWTQLRAGEPKLRILGQLMSSDEGRKAACRIQGLRMAVHLQRVAEIPIVGPVIASLFNVDSVWPTQSRLRALQQQLHDTSHSFDVHFEHIEQDLQLLRMATSRRKRLEIEFGHTSDRESPRQSGLMVNEEPEREQRARAAASLCPIVFQIEYAETASPASLGQNQDTRELAAGFRRIRISDNSSGLELCDISFKAGGNARDFVLFGFSDNEEWGTWTNGKKSAFVLWQQRADLGTINVSIEATPFQPAFSKMACVLSSSAGHRREFVLSKGGSDFDVSIPADQQGHAEMFFGGKLDTECKNNVSLLGCNPKLSIIILNFNKPQLSLLSARSVLAASISHPYEVIIADNGSTEESLAVLLATDVPVRVYSIPCNRYFGEGNNLGAEIARGEYLVFLNNDAFLAPGSIDSLRNAFDVDPKCGIAGPIFRYPDGRLQEAGSFIEADGVAEQRGKFGPPLNVGALPEFGVVDYVSAACLMIRTSRFFDLGGFNYRYDPAYFEDTDLCFRLRLRDEHVVLVRDAVCFHIENATTADKRSAAGVVSTVDHNRKVFLSIWGKYLASRSIASLPHGLIPPTDNRLRLRRGDRTNPFTQATYSPYPLVPGGGERYILAATWALHRLGPAAFVTPDPFSSVRLDSVMFDLGLPVGDVGTIPLNLTAAQKLERAIVMGNEIYPSVCLPAERSFFHCQFPFPLSDEGTVRLQNGLNMLAKFEKVIVNSEFTKRAYERELGRFGRSAIIEVVNPPVATSRLLALGSVRKPWILSIGRFSAAGHSKRQDVLIDAFKVTSREFRENWKLILCGTVPNNPVDRDYFRQMQESVGGEAEVEFVLSPSTSMLDSLLAQSSIYAHACGFGVRDPEDFWKCEHFGITLVEALVAGCQVLCYEVGGGPEIIARVGSGTTFGSIDELTSQLEEIADQSADPSIRRRASELFGDDAFYSRLTSIVN
jgi:GT2 family glycosyltransferase/glycosyltransferase involved in cell wall biosynthesis